MTVKLPPSAVSRIASLAVALLFLAGCSGAATSTTPPNAVPTIPAGSPGSGAPLASIGIPQPQQTGGPVTGRVGDTLTFYSPGDNNEVDATLVKVFDPAVPTDSSTLPAGARWVGVEVTLNNHSSDYMNEASHIDAVASDGTVLTTDDVYQGSTYILDKFQGCTQTANDEQDVQPFTHCVTFVVPDGQTLKQVGVKAGELVTFAAMVTDEAIWNLP